jgi:hypothetical protein
VSVAYVDFNLGATANKFLQTPSTDIADARFVIRGLIGDASAEDIEIIGKSVVFAYNSAYEMTPGRPQLSQTWSTGCRTEASALPTTRLLSRRTPTSSVNLSSLVDIHVSWKPECRLCPPDDDSSVTKKNGDVHKTFEEPFCASLHASGPRSW